MLKPTKGKAELYWPMIRDSNGGYESLGAA